MSKQVTALEPPPDARESGGVEILRLFVVKNGLSLSIKQAFDNPEDWGRALAELAGHIAGLYAISDTHSSAADALAEIQRAMEAHWPDGDQDFASRH